MFTGILQVSGTPFRLDDIAAISIIFLIIIGCAIHFIREIIYGRRGQRWNIEFEDGNNETIKVPQDYQESENCYYTESLLAYNNNDAINLAVYNLLKSLDLNSNRKIETKFSESDVVVSSSEIKGIPFTWDTEVQARVWR